MEELIELLKSEEIVKSINFLFKLGVFEQIFGFIIAILGFLFIFRKWRDFFKD